MEEEKPLPRDHKNKKPMYPQDLSPQMTIQIPQFEIGESFESSKEEYFDSDPKAYLIDIINLLMANSTGSNANENPSRDYGRINISCPNFISRILYFQLVNPSLYLMMFLHQNGEKGCLNL